MERLTLNLVPAGVMPEAHASQFDNGRVIRFSIKNGDSAYTLTGAETITANITKADGEQEVISIPNTSSDYIDLTTEETTCSVPGLYGCEITLTDGAEIIGSQNFILKVEADPYAGEDVRTITVGPADICTFETTLPEPLQSVLVNVEATGGNGTPDSPIPINGYTEANITRCGVNLFDKSQLVDGKFYNIVGGAVIEQSNANKAHLPLLKVKPSTTYYMSGFAGNSYYTIIALDADKNPITYYGGASKTEPFLATLPNNCEFVYLNINIELADTTIFCESNEIIPYTPYNGQTYAIAFGQTVYGGVLDVTRGKLHVTYGIVDLSDTSKFNFTYDSISNRWQSPFGDIKVFAQRSADVLAEQWQADVTAASGSESKFFTVGGALYFYTSDNANKPDGNLVYPLKTPFDIDLTPEVISAVVGENNVFAGCGQTEVKYLKAGD